MSQGDGFKKMLVKWLEIKQPERILEWGPGVSTLIMRQFRQDASITTIEHQKKYFDRWYQEFAGLKINMFLIDDPEDAHMERYTNPPVAGLFDLIFVDGRQRVDCMKTSLKLLSPTGILMLHDAERGYYKEGIDLYKKVDEGDDTVCLMLK